jgi:hypothetical protein
MPYAVSSPPLLVAQGVGSGRKVWFYESVDAVTLVRVSGYITNGWDLGMRKGDLVFAIDTDASPISMQAMIVTSASATAGVDLSDGTAITATDSD